jgi:hypothetical protein
VNAREQSPFRLIEYARHRRKVQPGGREKVSYDATLPEQPYERENNELSGPLPMVENSDIDRENRIAPIFNLRYCEGVGTV